MSRFFLAGMGPDGRSTVVKSQEIVHTPVANQLVAGFSLVDDLAPANTQFLDLEAMGIMCPPGSAYWGATRFAPGENALHWTATVDFDIVLSGSTVLILEDGEVSLRAGDCVLIDGVSHGWRTEGDGCELIVLFVGKPVIAVT